MIENKKCAELADKVRDLFLERLGEFRAEDFVEVANLMGFHAVEKRGTKDILKPCGDNNYLPEIIGTNLQYAIEAYEWNTNIPMTEDGVIVSGFWDRGKEAEPPAGYEMAAGDGFLRLKA